jgi:hypothetical protein
MCAGATKKLARHPSLASLALNMHRADIMVVIDKKKQALTTLQSYAACRLFGRSLLHCTTVYLKDRMSGRLAVTGEDVQLMGGCAIHVLRERAFNRSTLRGHNRQCIVL